MSKSQNGQKAWFLIAGSPSHDSISQSQSRAKMFVPDAFKPIPGIPCLRRSPRRQIQTACHLPAGQVLALGTLRRWNRAAIREEGRMLKSGSHQHPAP